jgi:hypothetical protein
LDEQTDEQARKNPVYKVAMMKVHLQISPDVYSIFLFEHYFLGTRSNRRSIAERFKRNC